jgi:hypothetical protein
MVVLQMLSQCKGKMPPALTKKTQNVFLMKIFNELKHFGSRNHAQLLAMGGSIQ